MTSRRRGLLIVFLYILLAGLAAWRFGWGGKTKKSSPQNEMIAVVEIHGPISLSMDGFGGTDIEAIVKELKSIRDRKDIKAVLLRINSPGGSVAAVQEVHQEVVALRKAGKTVVSSFGDVAASGGYYIAAASDKIVANPGTLTGSIGVLFQLGNVQELFKKVGVRVETIRSGEMKDAGSPFRPLSPKERAVFESLVMEAYEQFFRAVAEGRKMPDQKLRPLADGRIFTGTQAKAEGLVDELGNFNTAVEIARQLAGIQAKEPVIYRTHGGAWGRFLKLFNRSAAAFENRLPFRQLQKNLRYEYVWE